MPPFISVMIPRGRTWTAPALGERLASRAVAGETASARCPLTAGVLPAGHTASEFSCPCPSPLSLLSQ